MASAPETQDINIDPRDLVRIAWRRKWFAIIPASLLLIACFFYITNTTPMYQSEATIFIEDQDVPEDLVPSLMNDIVDRRLDMLTRRVLLTNSVLQIIDSHNLYPEARETSSRMALAAKVRDNIGVSLLSTEVTDPNSGRTGDVTVAFRVSFTHEDPDTARQVTNELVSLYLATNLEVRRGIAEQTTSFLAEERTSIERRITEIESRFTRFQTENRELLPEEMAFSRQMLANVEQELNALEQDLRTLKEREGFLTTQLAFMDEFEPRGIDGRGATPESQLELLRAELATASARYSDTHPDVLRLRREVRSLESVVGTRSQVNTLVDQEASLAADLGVLRERYTADHPDVVRVERQLASVREAIATNGSGDAAAAVGVNLDRNPAFVQLKAQLNSVQTEISSIEQRRQDAQEERAVLQERLARAPAVEREYTRLARELDNAIADRDILADKEATAQLSRSLEVEAVGERLVLAEPPTLPEFPVSPNKKLILAIGLVLAMGSSGGAVLLAELLDRSIRSTKDLASIIGDTPLVAIPSIVTPKDQRRTRTVRLAVVVLVVTTVGGALYWYNQAVTPLDVLWFEFQNRAVEFLPATATDADVSGLLQDTDAGITHA